MTRKPKFGSKPDLCEECDFSGGVRGKYATRYAEACSIVVLALDVVDVFPDGDVVTEALRGLAKSGRRSRHVS